MTKKITGTKTATEQKAAIAKAVAKGKGPKAGSAMANQSVKLSAADQKQIKDEAASRSKVRANPDTIKEAGMVTASGKDYFRVASGAGAENSELFSAHKLRGELAKLAVVGGSLRAVRAFLKTNKPEAKLATGLDGRNAPQSAQAAAASRVGKGAAAPQTGKSAPSKAAPKAVSSRASSAAGKLAHKGDDRAYVATAKEDTSREGTFRKYMISTIRAHGTVGAAKAAHAKSGQYAKDKLNHNWAAQNGFIKFV